MSLRGVSAFASRFPVLSSIRQGQTKQTTSTFLLPHNNHGRTSFSTELWRMRGGSQTEAFPTAATTRLASTATPEETVTVESAARECTSITGSSLQPSLFANTIPYWDTANFSAFRVVFILGGPGAGKGTQSNLLKDEYPCVHLSVGELLREEQTREGSPHRQLIEECLVAGQIVPVEISLALLREAMEREQAARGPSLLYLVDGFPRNFDNLLGWQAHMSEAASVWGVLSFTCPLPELERRILERAETSGRSDDNLTSARKRFQTFERDTLPVVESLQRVQELQQEADVPALKVWNIQGDQSLECVWKDTQCIVNQWILQDVLTANAQLLKAVQDGDADAYLKECAEEYFTKKSPTQVLSAQEGDLVGELSNAVVEFVSGTKVVVSYDRSFGKDQVRESRVWSHQGQRGWVNVHFSRTPQ